MIMISNLIFPIILFIISLFIIIIGVVLTISIIFFYIGIPLIIIGLILILISILSFFGATINSIFSLFRPRHKVDIKEKPRKKKKGKIIDVKEEKGIYRPE